MRPVYYPAQLLPLGSILYLHDASALRVESVRQNHNHVHVAVMDTRTGQMGQERVYRFNEAVAVSQPALRPGQAVIVTHDDIRLSGEIMSEVEGWFEVKLRDDSTAIVCPSRLTPVPDAAEFQALVQAAVERLGELEVARRCCVSRPTVDRWARGETRPHHFGRPSVVKVLST